MNAIKILWYIPFGMLLLFELTADYFAKEWSSGKHPYLWVIAISCYVIGNLFWLIALKNGSGLARGTVLFSLMSELLTISMALLYFHESISRMQAIGIILGIVSLTFLLWE